MCDNRNPTEFNESSANSVLWCRMASFRLHKSHAGKDLGFAMRLLGEFNANEANNILEMHCEQCNRQLMGGYCSLSTQC